LFPKLLIVHLRLGLLFIKLFFRKSLFFIYLIFFILFMLKILCFLYLRFFTPWPETISSHLPLPLGQIPF